MNRRAAIWTGVGTFLAIGSGKACLWDTDTLKDETASNPGLLDLILGQFPHHGEVYYQTRVDRLKKVENLSLEQLNDLAVAYVRLKEFTKADELLNKALQQNPKHYYTLSNLGVSAKKQGEFGQGVKFIEQALSIKPEGHMGLGDWYLHALRWRAVNESKGALDPPKANFLGKSYAANFSENHYGMEMPNNSSNLEDAKKYIKLVRNDQGFADGFVGMGDCLTATGHFNTSFLAYTRAMMLGHQNPNEVRRRRRTFLKYSEYHIQKSNKRLKGVAYWKQEIAQAEVKINKAAEWLGQYKLTEGKLVKAIGDERKVSIEDVEKSLLAQGVKRVRI